MIDQLEFIARLGLFIASLVLLLGWEIFRQVKKYAEHRAELENKRMFLEAGIEERMRPYDILLVHVQNNPGLTIGEITEAKRRIDAAYAPEPTQKLRITTGGSNKC